MARFTEDQAGGMNVLRLLDLIVFSEETSPFNGSDDGYNLLCGSGLFDGYQDQPCRRQTFPINGKLMTSAAVGRY
ncbi:hypothetical protein [Pseudomonas sp. p1(2021b)]|uniref:hypothetical protein n=1 Tax=Pseudomonas sp. p1(2021b) TaxID=2874628 RepID=UPI00398D2AF6